MSDIQRYLLDYDRNKQEATAVAQQSAKRLENGELKLLTLIGELGEYLNSEDATVRSRTVGYLAEVLAAVPQKVLSLQQRNLLCDFVLSRIEDRGSLGSCARALIALEERGKWENERVTKIMESLLEDTHPLSQYKLQSERYPVLRLIDMMMAKYRDALRNLHDSSPDFMSKFILYFDGEKDPRNLMIVFAILKVPMTEWSIGADAQLLFDAVFNYFPITFRPRPEDPYGITAQDLKDRLRECIASTPDFAPYAFPALLDKLDSTSMNTKRDVLQAITATASEYGHQTMSLYSITLWDALKFEILNVQEEDLAEEALNGLAAIAKTLSQGTAGPFEAYLRPIMKECNEHLEDAPTKQSQASARILSKIADVSAGVCNTLLSGILPHLLRLFQTADTIAKRRGLLEVMVQMIRANIHVYGDWRSIGTAGEHPPVNTLIQFKDQALEVMLNGLETAPVKEVSFRMVCLDGLLRLAQVRELLSDEDIGRIIELFHSIVIHEESYGKDEVKEAAISGLVDIAHQKPSLVVDKAFPAFMAQLPDSDSDGSKGYVQILEAFAKLASEERVFDTVIVRLKNKFHTAVKQNASRTYIVALLSAILYALNANIGKVEQAPGATLYYQDIVLPLLRMASGTEGERPKAFEDERTLDLVGRICNVILRYQSVELQSQISPELYTLFKGVPQDRVPPFNSSTPPEQTKTMVVSTHLLASFRKETALPCEVQVLISSLVDFSQQTYISSPVRSASLRQISLLFNKYIPTPSLRTCMEPLINPPVDLFSTEKLDPSRIRIIFACLRALLLRNSPSLSSLYPRLLSFLSHPTQGATVARGFATLLQPDDLLTKQNHCQISGLHKQKSFALLVPSITQSFREASPEMKPNYLIALSGILKWIPFEVVVEEVVQLAPLLLQSLDLRGEDLVKEAAIGTLTSIVQESPKAVEGHAGALIARLLDNSTPSPSRNAPMAAAGVTESTTTPARVRAMALVCLTLVAQKFRQEIVLPYRKQVVKMLTGALDDKKREVRSAAVKCRTTWIVIDEPGDDD
ncbi:MMS19 nucleotide excision repair protein-like protein [Westerdykella ornata]|uniref:MMS19 nucleotide excision repair protein n=1 Tax=Westerdykella ornata TaxID=318751 RepID=A0A6A6JM00_WESOR|nr:MMS19 nucleotide excision repair protein-like protein [Westerdykella ornata]KAF2277532.1 MMS19 nucleotide excision repair protein-like protein [Westerdykella ornata]